MGEQGKEPKKFRLKDKWKYLNDTLINENPIAVLLLLNFFVMIFVVLLGFVIFFSGAKGEDATAASSIWDLFAATLNGWVIFYNEGGFLYRVYMAIGGIVGMVLLGAIVAVIVSMLPSRTMTIRDGYSPVVTQGHVIILGFGHGTFELIRQVIWLRKREKCTIVIADPDQERGRLQERIKKIIEIPRGIRIVCRRVDICDPADLENLSISQSSQVVIDSNDDAMNAKALMAISSLVRNETSGGPEIAVCIYDKTHIMPAGVAGPSNAAVVYVGDLTAKLIAQKCYQRELDMIYTEILSVDGAEFRIIPAGKLAGESFREIQLLIDQGTPAGIIRDRKHYLVPDGDTEILPDDGLLILSDGSTELRILSKPVEVKDIPHLDTEIQRFSKQIVIFGPGRELKSLMDMLAVEDDMVILTGLDQKERQEWKGVSNVSIARANIKSSRDIDLITRICDEVIILSDPALSDEEADNKTIFTLLRLRSFRDDTEREFSVTAEMRLEKNRNLARLGDFNERIIPSSVSTRFLAQALANPLILDTLSELLSAEGKQFCVLPEDVLGKEDTWTSADLRIRCLKENAVYAGYMKMQPDGSYLSFLSPGLNDEVTFQPGDKLVVIKERECSDDSLL